MKTKFINVMTFAMAMLFVACEENEVMPGYQQKRTATHTAASLTVSDDEPTERDIVTILMTYVHLSSDPLTQIQLKAKVDAADYVVVHTITPSAADLDREVSTTFNYEAPMGAATVVLDMVLSSGKEYPQILRVTLDIHDGGS